MSGNLEDQIRVDADNVDSKRGLVLANIAKTLAAIQRDEIKVADKSYVFPAVEGIMKFGNEEARKIRDSADMSKGSRCLWDFQNLSVAILQAKTYLQTAQMYFEDREKKPEFVDASVKKCLDAAVVCFGIGLRQALDIEKSYLHAKN